MDILYCFITHQSELHYDTISIREMCIYQSIFDYVIVCGGFENNSFDYETKLLKLNCDDTYEGLPDKIHKLFHFLVNDDTFSRYKFYAKLDRRINLKRNIDLFILNGDYCGRTVRVKPNCDGNRTWHIGKCSPDSKWSIKKYEGKFVPWCDGGNGYVLSNYAANLIAKNPPNSDEEIYEDQYIAQRLLQHDIHPSTIYNIHRFFQDKDKL